MATGFILNKVNFGNVADTQQTMTFQYKLYSDPESSYSTFGSGLVDTDGTILISPLPDVTGLTPGTVYYVRAFNACSSPVDYFVKQIPT